MYNLRTTADHLTWFDNLSLKQAYIMKLYRPVKWLRDIDRKVSQYFWENFKRNGKRMYWEIVKERKSHQGIDYVWPVKWVWVKIYSCTQWVVVMAWVNWWFGNTIVIEFTESWVTYQVVYAHLASIWVSVWQTVQAMQEIWFMGKSWNSTGVHLHLWLRPKGKRWIDPTPYISDRQSLVVTPEITDEAKKAVDAGIRNWERPKDPATREEVAMMIWRSKSK